MADAERIGPYRLVRRLGAGGMGAVYLAYDERLDRRVALKRLHVGSDIAAERRERFRREAKIAARLNHPAVVQIHDVVRMDEDDWIVMEYVEGEDLRWRLQAGPVGWPELLRIAREIAEGMAEAHDRGVIHRDLKCENVLVTRAGHIKITDFGIAEILGDAERTAGGVVAGTLRAMSPEQACGRPVDRRSDLFSFGVLLYEALTGTSPFLSDTPYLTMQQVVHARPRPLGELVPGIPRALAALIEQLLNKSPLLRPRDFHEVADALSDIAGDAQEGSCCCTARACGRAPQLAADDARTGDELARPPAFGEDRGDVTAAARHGPSLALSRPRQRSAGVITAMAIAAAGLGYLIGSIRTDVPAVRLGLLPQRALVCAVAANEVLMLVAYEPSHTGHTDAGMTEVLFERCEHAAERSPSSGRRRTGEEFELRLRELGGGLLEQIGALPNGEYCNVVSPACTVIDLAAAAPVPLAR